MTQSEGKCWLLKNSEAPGISEASFQGGDFNLVEFTFEVF